MYLREMGAGPSVLLLHGTPSPATDWLPVAERLASTYRVFIPDLPGYGQSPPAADATHEVVSASLAALLAERGAGRLRGVVGFSTGGYRALELALRGMIEVEVVVGLGTFATLDDDGRALRRGFAQALRADPQFLHGPDVRSFFEQMMLSPSWIAAHPADLERVLGWANLTTAPALAAELDALAAIADLRAELPQLKARLTLRVGELDLGAPPAVSEELHRLVPGSSLEVVPGCGHALLIEDLEATTVAIIRALVV